MKNGRGFRTGRSDLKAQRKMIKLILMPLAIQLALQHAFNKFEWLTGARGFAAYVVTVGGLFILFWIVATDPVDFMFFGITATVLIFGGVVYEVIVKLVPIAKDEEI